MKSIVRDELEHESYVILEEPLFPPSNRISWSNYRPDLLGFRSDLETEEIVIVECETRPSMNRFRLKNYASLWFQPSVLTLGRTRRILAVPRGRLHSVDLQLRNQWEIWVLGSVSPIQKISSISPNYTEAVGGLSKSSIGCDARMSRGGKFPPAHPWRNDPPLTQILPPESSI